MESVTIEDRKKLTVLGAERVLSTTATQAVVDVKDCSLVISGTAIEVTKLNLDQKEVIFAGEFLSVKYAKKTEKVGLFKRLFK